jgi:hypothetical protein
MAHSNQERSHSEPDVIYYNERNNKNEFIAAVGEEKMGFPAGT